MTNDGTTREEEASGKYAVLTFDYRRLPIHIQHGDTTVGVEFMAACESPSGLVKAFHLVPDRPHLSTTEGSEIHRGVIHMVLADAMMSRHDEPPATYVDNGSAFEFWPRSTHQVRTP